MMRCATARENLTAFQRGELPPARAEELRGHLARCRDCQTELQALERLHRLLQVTSIAPRPGFVPQLMRTVTGGDAGAGRSAAGSGQTGDLHSVIDDLQRRLLTQRQSLHTLSREVRRRGWTIVVSALAHAAVFLVLAYVVLDFPGAADSPERYVRLVKPYEHLLPAEDGSGDTPSNATSVIGGGADHIPIEVPPGLEEEDLPLLGPERGAGAGQEEIDPRTYPPGGGRGLADAPVEDRLFDRLAETARRPAQEEGLLAARTDPALRRQALRLYESVAPPAPLQDAVGHGLRWLTREQREDGSWDAAREGGEPHLEVAVTSLCLLTFLAEGYSTATPGSHGEVLRRGIAYLEDRQDASSGGIGQAEGNRPMFNHGISTLALCENLALLEAADEQQEARHRRPAARQAVRFMVNHQIRSPRRSPGAGGWGYRPDSRITDTSVSAWQVQALLAYELTLAPRGKVSSYADRAYRGVGHWLQSYTDSLTGQVGYDGLRRYREAGPATLTAMGLVSALAAGEPPGSPLLQAQARLVAQHPPQFDLDGGEEPDLCRAYFGTLSLYLQEADSEQFRRWWRRVTADLLEQQVQEGAKSGSWPPWCRWAGYGGRYYTTAMALLTMQTPYRFRRAGR